MKALMTKKEIMRTNEVVLKVAYCELQHLLAYTSPYAYTAGLYGWGSDVYCIKGIAISTGYKAFGNVEPSHEFLQSYDNKAEIILCSLSTIDEIISSMDALLEEFATIIKSLAK